jgi:Ca2+-binding EF-hand superfamily protein
MKTLIRELQGVSTSEEDIVTTYRLFDRQGKGYFDRKELQAVLERYTGGKVADKDLAQIMSMGQNRKGAEGPADPVISKEVFISLFN